MGLQKGQLIHSHLLLQQNFNTTFQSSRSVLCCGLNKLGQCPHGASSRGGDLGTVTGVFSTHCALVPWVVLLPCVPYVFSCRRAFALAVLSPWQVVLLDLCKTAFCHPESLMRPSLTTHYKQLLPHLFFCFLILLTP